MPTYVCYAGTGKASPSGAEVSLTAAEVATLYGLAGGEYTVGATGQEQGVNMDADHIHLSPRPDGKYRNIKTLLGDNGTDTMIDHPASWYRKRRERELFT